MHIRQPGFTYSACACGPFMKSKERIQEFKETEDSRYIYQNKLDKVCFQHSMAYGNFKGLTRRTVSDNTLHDKAHDVPKNFKYDGCQRGLALMVYKCFDSFSKLYEVIDYLVESVAKYLDYLEENLNVVNEYQSLEEPLEVTNITALSYQSNSSFSKL